MFDYASLSDVLTIAEITTLRRSATMAPPSPASVAELLGACEQMARERDEIAAVLDALPATFAEVRAAQPAARDRSVTLSGGRPGGHTVVTNA